YVARQEFEEAAEPMLERTVEATMAAVVESGVAPQEVGAVLLTGAASVMPLVSASLALATGFTPVLLNTPGSTAVHGALDLAAPLVPPPVLPAIRPMAQLPAPTGAPPSPSSAGWRWPVLVGVAAVLVLAVVLGIALVALWPSGGTASSTVDSSHAVPSLTPRPGAPNLRSTFA